MVSLLSILFAIILLRYNSINNYAINLIKSKKPY